MSAGPSYKESEAWYHGSKSSTSIEFQASLYFVTQKWEKSIRRSKELIKRNIFVGCLKMDI